MHLLNSETRPYRPVAALFGGVLLLVIAGCASTLTPTSSDPGLAQAASSTCASFSQTLERVAQSGFFTIESLEGGTSPEYFNVDGWISQGNFTFEYPLAPNRCAHVDLQGHVILDKDGVIHPSPGSVFALEILQGRESMGLFEVRTDSDGERHLTRPDELFDSRVTDEAAERVLGDAAFLVPLITAEAHMIRARLLEHELWGALGEANLQLVAARGSLDGVARDRSRVIARERRHRRYRLRQLPKPGMYAYYEERGRQDRVRSEQHAEELRASSERLARIGMIMSAAAEKAAKLESELQWYLESSLTESEQSELLKLDQEIEAIALRLLKSLLDGP